jgi:thioesterase domain-containing protein
MLGIYAAALRHYVPRHYPGRVLIWKTKETACDVQLWKSISAEAEIEEIPGGHIQILEEPYIKGWAERLSRELRAATTYTLTLALPMLVSPEVATLFGF